MPLKDQVYQVLLEGDLSRLRQWSVAEALGTNAAALRNVLQHEGTTYQALLDRARMQRCDQLLQDGCTNGKAIGAALGYRGNNSFFRLFQKWTGVRFCEFKKQDPIPSLFDDKEEPA